MSTLRIAIVGNGAVAEGLAREFSGTTGVALVQQWTRRTHRPEDLAAAELYVLAVSDAAVAEVSAALPFAPGATVAHTAGSVEMLSMSPTLTHRAVLYPLQSFTRGRVIDDFRRTPFFIEGATEHALATVREAAEAISDNVIEMDSGRRAVIHLAGAFANNFSNAMLSISESIAADAGAGFEVLRPIVAETLNKALSMPSPRDAQTGAAQRGDRTIHARHLAILAATHPNLTELYKEISHIISSFRSRSGDSCDKVLPLQGRI